MSKENKIGLLKRIINYSTKLNKLEEFIFDIVIQYIPESVYTYDTINFLLFIDNNYTLYVHNHIQNNINTDDKVNEFMKKYKNDICDIFNNYEFEEFLPESERKEERDSELAAFWGAESIITQYVRSPEAFNKKLVEIACNSAAYYIFGELTFSEVSVWDLMDMVKEK